MKKKSPEYRYTFRVVWSETDQEFVGLCAECPGLSWLDKDSDRAFRGIKAVVRKALDDMERSNETPPEPISGRQFRGKFQVRTLPAVHRQLVIEAAENGVSLNRLINAKLTRGWAR